MELKTDLIHLSPDDEPETFFKKLGYISESKLIEEVERFKKYDWYPKLLKFHLVTLQQPEWNIRLAYNDEYGWHATSCVRSLPEEKQMINLSKCTCEEDFNNPKDFFNKVKYEMVYRCKVCKRYIPEWEEDAGIKFHEDGMGLIETEPREEKVEFNNVGCKCRKELEESAK